MSGLQYYNIIANHNIFMNIIIYIEGVWRNIRVKIKMSIWTREHLVFCKLPHEILSYLLIKKIRKWTFTVLNEL